MSKQFHCSKCGGSMIEGFAMELPTGRQAVNCWVEGIVERSWWTGIKFINKRRHPITTYCCDKCGYLESFANLNIQGWK
jgi:predicted RNA-binding Zn-ribbon protein involved in translation (DUF1610 family)